MRKVSVRTISTFGIATAAILIAFAVFASLSATRNPEVRHAIPRYGNLFQSGALAGWASGAKISQLDSSVVEFDQISHARQLVQQDEFEYGDLRMRISQVVQVDYLPSSEIATGRGAAARPNKTLVRVTARIQPSR
jgi:hypothetical protein